MSENNQLWKISAVSLALALQFLPGSAAWAHHPTISADAVCDPATGDKSINYTSTSWLTTGDPGSGGGNSQIDIILDTTVIDSQPYVAPDYSFSGSVGTTAPTGQVLHLVAEAVGNWDSGAPGGQTESISVTVPEDCAAPQLSGRFTGGGRQIRIDGARITRGLTIHCDLTLSNNLQVNWSNGNKFHMTEHLETVVCSDDPNINQAPPPAPIDTLVGVGTGRFNNVDGYTIEFTLSDHGEPGDFDEAAFLIYPDGDPGNPVLEVLQQRLDGGNLQAHADQPHK